MVQHYLRRLRRRPFAADWYALGITALEMIKPDLWTTLYPKVGVKDESDECPVDTVHRPREVTFLPDQEIHDIIFNFLMVGRIKPFVKPKYFLNINFFIIKIPPKNN